MALWGMLLHQTLVVISNGPELNKAEDNLGGMTLVFFVSVTDILAAYFAAQKFLKYESEMHLNDKVELLFDVAYQ